MARRKAPRRRRLNISVSLGSQAVGEGRQVPAEEMAAVGQRSLRMPAGLKRLLTGPALASVGQLFLTWLKTATGLARTLPTAAAGHKRTVLKLSFLVLLFTLAMVNSYFFITWWTLRRTHKDSMVQEIERLQQAVSEQREQLDCYQTPDWALKSFGASIDLQRTSPTYTFKCWVCRLRWFWRTMNPPDTILQPGVSLGECWPMEGQRGQVVIRLRAEILPTCVTLEHIMPEMTPTGTALSAPRDVAVFGLDVGSEEEVPLGSFTFHMGKEPTQTFLLKNHHSGAFGYIKVLVKSNWGHPDYTCIYRVQVHGKGL